MVAATGHPDCQMQALQALQPLLREEPSVFENARAALGDALCSKLRVRARFMMGA
jgi:hypothetical protein